MIATYAAHHSPDVLTAFLHAAADANNHRSSHVLDVLDALSTLQRPPATLVAAQCRLLQLFSAEARPAASLALDEQWQQTLLSTTGLLSRVSWHQHVDAHAAVHTAPDAAERGAAVQGCVDVLDGLMDRFLAVEEEMQQQREAWEAEVRRRWRSMPVQRRATIMFQRASSVGLPYDADRVDAAGEDVEERIVLVW